MRNIRSIRFLMIILIAMFITSGCSTDDTDQTPISFLFHDYALNAEQNELELFTLVNNHRDSIGINTLGFDKNLHDITVNRNISMINKGFISHDGIFEIRDKIRLIGLITVYENLSFGYSSVVSAYNALTTSPGHLKNIEDPRFRYTAISVLFDENGKMYIVQLFVY